VIDDVEALITTLVQSAPARDPIVVRALIDALSTIGSPLALSIARIVELVDEELVDPGIALPALAMACATLVDGVAGRLGPRELEAARYEIETLQPMPDGARPVSPEALVPLKIKPRPN
jgi:hypothetical protein